MTIQVYANRILVNTFTEQDDVHTPEAVGCCRAGATIMVDQAQRLGDPIETFGIDHGDLATVTLVFSR